MEKAILVGNDINNATGNYSWAQLLKGLLEYAQVDQLNMENKPFPMLYEEIYLNSAKKYKTPEGRIKAFISSQTRKLVPNILHEEILNLGIENIMTTNYDLLFERQGGFDKKRCRNYGCIKESTYNVFRH